LAKQLSKHNKNIYL